MVNLIDIGSNTIRLVTYNKKKCISNVGMSSEIIGDTKDGILSEEGIEKLCGTLSFLKEKRTEGDIYAFGTYAVRVLKNKEDVKNTVLRKTGIEIDILSGQQEAEYDFYGLLSTIGRDESGIGVDLGGGSAQILIFDRGELLESVSCPIGCKRMKNRFAYGRKATDADYEEIRKYIDSYLSDFKDKRTDTIYMMGGTAKAAVKLYRFLSGINCDIIKTNEIIGILDFISEAEEKNLRKILKTRYDSISVGIVIMQEIANVFGAKNIFVKKCGVRDGYVSRLIK